VGCGAIVVGIPAHAVERVLRIPTDALAKAEGRPVVVVEKRTLPLCILARLIGEERPGPAVMRNPAEAVVLRTPSARFAVVVDRLLDERDTVIKELRGPAGRMDRFSGGFILEDGGVGLVLNPIKLAESSAAGQRLTVEAAAESLAEPRPPTILIVDDSFTTRTLEKSIFEAHGYCVKLAVDGVDALRQLRSERVDLIVSDIQMPRMDGFQLMEELKRDARLASLPVVLVTSMDRREHRERGLTLGADAYIVKQKFDHEDLLRTVEQLIEPGGSPPGDHRRSGGGQGVSYPGGLRSP